MFKETLIKKFSKRWNSLGVIILRSFSIPIRYILNWIGAYLYGPAIMGAFSTTRSFLDISITVGGLGSDKTMIRFLGHAYAKNKKQFITTFLILGIVFLSISMLLGALIFFTAPFIANFYNKPQLVNFFKITGVTIPVAVMLILVQQAFRATKHPYLATTFETVLFNISVLFFAILLFFIGYKTYGFHVGFLIGTLLTLLIGILIFIWQFKDSLRHHVTKKELLKSAQLIRKTIKVGLALTLVNIIYLVLANLDRILLPKFTDTATVGIYYIATRGGALLQVINVAFLSITPPHISKFYVKKDWVGLVNYVKKQTKFSVLLTLLLAIILVPITPFLLSLFGTSYVNGTTITYIMLATFIALAFGGIAGQAVIIINKHKQLLTLISLWVFIVAIIMWFLGMHFGATGLAIGTLVSAIGQSGIHWLVLASAL